MKFVALLSIAMFSPTAAWALSMEPNPLPYEHVGPSYLGTIHLVSIGSGADILAAGGIDLLGSTSPTSVVAAFFVQHGLHALASIEPEAQLHLPQSLGWIPDSNGKEENLTASSGAFHFFLDGSSRTSIFYVSFPDLVLGEELSFTLAPTIFPEATVTAVSTVVPEPASAALLALGLVVLGVGRRV